MYVPVHVCTHIVNVFKVLYVQCTCIYNISVYIHMYMNSHLHVHEHREERIISFYCTHTHTCVYYNVHIHGRYVTGLSLCRSFLVLQLLRFSCKYCGPQMFSRFPMGGVNIFVLVHVLCIEVSEYDPSYDRLPFDDYNGVSAHSHVAFLLFIFSMKGSNGPVLCEMETSKLHCQ